jgi:hypothetical protein
VYNPKTAAAVYNPKTAPAVAKAKTAAAVDKPKTAAAVPNPLIAAAVPNPMKAPAKVAELLSADWYKEHWPLIPPQELDASSVDLSHLAPDGKTLVKTKVLMHKRRVSSNA